MPPGSWLLAGIGVGMLIALATAALFDRAIRDAILLGRPTLFPASGAAFRAWLPVAAAAVGRRATANPRCPCSRGADLDRKRVAPRRGCRWLAATSKDQQSDGALHRLIAHLRH